MRTRIFRSLIIFTLKIAAGTHLTLRMISHIVFTWYEDIAYDGPMQAQAPTFVSFALSSISHITAGSGTFRLSTLAFALWLSSFAVYGARS